MKRIFRWFLYFIGFIVFLYLTAFGMAMYYEKDILARINQELQKNVDGEVQVGGLSLTIFEQFPSPSITLKDIYLRGPRYDRYHKEFLSAEKVYVNVQAIMLLRGEINLRSLIIKKARINIFKTSDGYSNLEMFRKNQTPDTAKHGKSSISLVLRKVRLEDTWVSFYDSMKGKSYGARFLNTVLETEPTDSSTLIRLNGHLFFEGMMFNSQKGPYLGNQDTQTHFDLEFLRASKQLVIRPSSIRFSKGSEVALEGYFKFDSTASYGLMVQSENLDFAEGRTIVTPAIASKLKILEIERSLTIQLDVLGKTTPGNDPKIDLSFSTRNNSLKVSGLTAEDISFAGVFMNHVREDQPHNDPNSRIQLDHCAGRINGIPTDMSVTLEDLKDPTLTLRSDIKTPLQDLNTITDTTKLKFTSGDFHAHVDYHGRLKEYMNKETTVYNGKLDGSVEVINGGFVFAPKEKKFEQINVNIRFNEKKMDFAQVAMSVNGNEVELKGSVEGFVPFFFQPAGKGKVSLSIYSPRMDLSTLIRKKKTTGGPAQRKKVPSTKVTDMLNTLNDKVEFDAEVRVDEIVNGALRATNLVSKTQLHNGTFRTSSAKLKFAGGTVSMLTTLSALDRDTSFMQLKTEVLNVDVKKFFAAFDNFSQRAITSEHLEGRISTWIDLSGKIDPHFKLLLPTVQGTVRLKLKDGSIQNFEPLEKMGTFLFKKRDFTDVDFAEINGNFHIKGPSIDIDRMEIQSSVLTMFIEGRYSMADSTDLSIQVPLSNLKKRDKDYKPENVGVDSKVGPSVFIRATNNKEGKLKISYDPFKKMRKK